MELIYKRKCLISTHPWKIARTKRCEQFEVVIIELRDQSGLIGYGEAAPITRYRESASSVEKFLAAVDPKRLERDDVLTVKYIDSLSAGDFAAKCGLNVALNDLYSKRRGKALHESFGLDFRENTYVTSFTIGIDSPEIIKLKVAEAEQFPMLKIKVGSRSDRENIAALRQIAPSKPIRVDANEGWVTKEEALENIRWLAEDKNIQFVEQPMPAATPGEDWVWLKKRSPLPIFADESYHTARDIHSVVQCFHGVNVKLSKTGGINGAFEALQAARKQGLQTMLGCMIETSILISAAAQLASLCDYLDLDGNLLITNDPYQGVEAKQGLLSFAQSLEKSGIRVTPRLI